MSSACEEIRLLLPDALTGRLSPAHAAEVDGHLAACAACRAHRDRLALAAKALDEAFPKASPARRHVWARVERSVRERAEARGVAAPQSGELPATNRRRLLWATAAAAALVCAIVLVSRFSRGRAEPTPEIARAPAVSPQDVVPVAEFSPPSYKGGSGEFSLPSPPASGLAARRDPTAPALPPETSQVPAPPVTPAPEIAEAEPEDLELPDFERETAEPPQPPPAVAEKRAPAPERPVAPPEGSVAQADNDVLPAQPPVSQLEPAPAAAARPERGTRERVDDALGMALMRRSGPVVVYDERHRTWRAVSAGEAIPYGARVRTGPGSCAELAFGGTRLWLDAGTDLAVSRAEDRSRRAELAHGRLRVDLLRPEAAFSVHAGGGAVELTGTVVEVEAAAPRLAFVRTLEGRVRVQPLRAQGAAEPFEVAAGEEALVAFAAGDELLDALPPAYRDRARALFGAPQGRRAFPGGGEDWTKTLTQPPPKSRAVGQLLVKDEQGRPAEPLRIARMSVEARIRGPAALTRVDQSFLNNTDSTLEGTFYFPLPPGAALARFAMYVDNEQKTLIEGEVVEREYARQVYESILRPRRRDPALVEWMEGNLFKARIFPIPPRSLKRVILEYTQLLPATFETRRYVFPLVSELTRKSPIGSFALHAVLETGDGTSFTEVHSPSYRASTRVDGLGSPRATATLALENLAPSADFVLAFSAPRRAEVRAGAYAEAGEEPYLLLGFQPNPDSAALLQDAQAAGRDVLFVVETSGARSPADLDTQRQALLAMLGGLDPNADRVALAAADVNLVPLTNGWVRTFARELPEAEARLDARAPLGGLDLEAVLHDAAQLLAREANPDRPRVLVFIGAGVPALGTLDAARLVENAAAELEAISRARFVGVGVGRTVESLALGELARRTGGLYLPLKADEGLAETAFLAALSLQTPWLESPTLRVEGATVAGVYPAALGSLLPGQETFLHARLQGPAVAQAVSLRSQGDGATAQADSLRYERRLHGRPASFAATVAGQLNGKAYESRADVTLPPDLAADPALGRFWARARLDGLLTQPQTPQLRNEIVSLAKTWTLMSPYTSFLVLESEQDYARYEIKREQRRRIWRDDVEPLPVIVPERVAEPRKPAAETPEQRAQRLLQEAKRLAGPEDPARLTQADVEFQAGLRLFNEFQYEEAKKHLENAARLNPARSDVQEYLAKARAMLGERSGMFSGKLQSLAPAQRVMIQEQVAVLVRALEDGRQFEERSSEVATEVADSRKETILADQLDSLRQAQVRYRRVKEILNWMPPQVDLPSERRTVEEALGRVQKKIVEKEDEIRFLVRLQAAKLAEVQKLRDTELFKQRMSKLIEETAALYGRGEYVACEKLAKRILTLDPASAAAQGWVRRARSAQNDRQDERKTRPELTGQEPTPENRAQEHLRAGQRLLGAFAYEAAQAELARAASLDRNNSEARDLLVQVTDILARRRERVQSATQVLAASQRVAIQERLEHLDQRLDWGERFARQAQSDPELSVIERIRRNQQAVESFERARELIKWMPPAVSVEEQTKHATRRIGELRKAIAGLEVEFAQQDRETAAKLAAERVQRELNFQQKRVDMQMDQIKALYETGEYAKAEALAGKVLEMDRTNPEAHVVELSARDRKHIKRAEWINQEYDEQFERQKEIADGNRIPYQDYLIYPSNWHEIALRTASLRNGKASAKADGRAVSPADIETLKKEVAELRAKINTEGTAHFSPDWFAPEVDLVLDSKYGPNAAATIRRGEVPFELTLGGLTQAWYSGTGYSLDDSIWSPPRGRDAAPWEQRAAATDRLYTAGINYYLKGHDAHSPSRFQYTTKDEPLVPAVVDYDISGASWDPVIRWVPADQLEQTQRIQNALNSNVPAELILGQDPDAKTPALPPARVLAVRPDLDLIMLSIGSNQGVKPGYRMTVSRGDQYLAKAEVLRVYPDLCSARLLLKKGEVQVNDEANSRRPSLQPPTPPQAAPKPTGDAKDRPAAALPGEPKLDSTRKILRRFWLVLRGTPTDVKPEELSARVAELNAQLAAEPEGTALRGMRAAAMLLSLHLPGAAPDAEKRGLLMGLLFEDCERLFRARARAGEDAEALRQALYYAPALTFAERLRLLSALPEPDRDAPFWLRLGYLQSFSDEGERATAGLSSSAKARRCQAKALESWRVKHPQEPLPLAIARPAAILAARLEDKDGARAALRAALEGPARSDGRVLAEAAAVAAGVGLKDEAREYTRRALEALAPIPEAAPVRAVLCRNLASLLDGAAAFRALNDGILAFEGQGPHAEALARAFLARVRFEQDAAALEEALGFVQDSALKAHLAARCAEIVREPARRAEFLARAFEESGESPAFLKPYADALAAWGQAPRAIALCEAQLRKGSADPWLASRLADLYQQAGDATGHYRALTQAVALRPREPEPRRELAGALVQLGRGAEALREMRLACELRPEDLAIRREFAALARKLGDPAAREEALLGMLDRDWPAEDGDVWREAGKGLEKLLDEYKDAGDEVKAAELKARIARACAKDLVVQLKWDTDGTDVDLHVAEPSGHETYYQSKTSARGGTLDRDVTNGHGPETYSLRRGAPGTYRIYVRYFSGGKPTKATVKVTTHQGAPDEETRTFKAELKTAGETAEVLKLDLGR